MVSVCAGVIARAIGSVSVRTFQSEVATVRANETAAGLGLATPAEVARFLLPLGLGYTIQSNQSALGASSPCDGDGFACGFVYPAVPNMFWLREQWRVRFRGDRLYSSPRPPRVAPGLVLARLGWDLVVTVPRIGARFFAFVVISISLYVLVCALVHVGRIVRRFHGLARVFTDASMTRLFVAGSFAAVVSSFLMNFSVPLDELSLAGHPPWLKSWKYVRGYSRSTARCPMFR